MLKKDGDGLVFSTGKVIESLSGVIGLGREGYIGEGSNDCIHNAEGVAFNAEYPNPADEIDELTPAELKELATHMMTEWLRVYDKATTEIDPCHAIYECAKCGAFIIPGTESDYRNDLATDKYYCASCL